MEPYIVDVENLTIRFNMASEKVDNLKAVSYTHLKWKLKDSFPERPHLYHPDQLTDIVW